MRRCFLGKWCILLYDVREVSNHLFIINDKKYRSVDIPEFILRLEKLEDATN